jgi:ribosomal protein S18 acetylase RimI-like enzyme
VTSGIRIERLRPDHDRSGFDCGTPALDRYLRQQAGQDVRRGVANCFLAIDEAAGAILGFYTLAATAIPISSLSDHLRRKLPRYSDIPAALIGRLAVNRHFQRRRVASSMIIDAGLRSMRSDPAVFALVVDAKDQAATNFYRHNGFIPLDDEERRLFLPLATLRKAQAP